MYLQEYHQNILIKYVDENKFNSNTKTYSKKELLHIIFKFKIQINYEKIHDIYQYLQKKYKQNKRDNEQHSNDILKKNNFLVKLSILYIEPYYGKPHFNTFLGTYSVHVSYLNDKQILLSSDNINDCLTKTIYHKTKICDDVILDLWYNRWHNRKLSCHFHYIVENI